ncbi:MAG: hypothetical protein QOE06_11 [Thermoleophilaceae bacterium]|nr:hypothetical protein [Thermoleophilaceae bacterium]
MESASIAHPRPGAARETSEHGLARNAIGFGQGLVIALASTAPAYSIAAVIGVLVLQVGVQAPATLLAAFVPMLFIASAFLYMNRADPDCGTTFSWVARAMGPWAGWFAGWAVTITGVLVIGSLADVAARYLYLTVGWESAAASKLGVMILSVVFIALMTLMCILGTRLSARLQTALITVEMGALLLFSVVALVKVFSGHAHAGSTKPHASWFSPFAVSSAGALVSGLLVGVFIYWGWESSVNLNEETENPVTAPGRAAVLSTVILLFTYLAVSTAIVAFVGVKGTAAFEDESIFGAIGGQVLGSPLDKLLLLAIVTSGLASTQTTILPASRTVLSMARARALPSSLGRTHMRFLTPHVATIWIGAIATAFYVIANTINENFLFDTITALALLIAFYYAMSGFACVIYYRRELRRSVGNFVFMGLAPLIGGLILMYLFGKACVDFADVNSSYLGTEWLGVAPPLVIGLGALALGIVFMFVQFAFGDRSYFARRGFETVPPEVASGQVRVAVDTAGAGRDAT